jgi:hypothetical protein
MRVCKIFVRALIVLAIACGVYTAGANAQTLTVSPTDLSFGVPTGTSPAVSAPQTVTINIQGQGPVNFTGTSTSNPDFAVNGNSCTGTLTAPTTCQVSVVFTSTQPAGTMEVATLTITSGASPGTLSVPMNGALGAIEFFGALNINPSLFSGVTWTNNPPTAGNPVSSNTVALACPAGAVIKATLSSTPDGKSNVFQDNTMRIINTSSGGTTTNTPNVCLGGDTNFQGYTGFPGTTNCFQGSYENAASSYIGQNPDLATSPINTGLPGSFLATYGVPVIDISGLLGPGTQALTIELDDAGGDLGAATLHLVTSCSLAGAVPGGTITGNPINTNNPSSQTQTFTFDNGGGQNIGFTTSTSTAQQTNSVQIPTNTTPIITDIGIPQQLFSQLVNGTSAGPAVCLRMTGEIDSNNQAMCKAYLMQCQDPTNQTISGPNCVPNPSTARNLLDIARFESPDAPSGTNFLASACSPATGVPCAPTNLAGPNPVLIGPGMLMGSDSWLCPPGSDLTNCTNQELTVANPTGGTYASANCQFTGSLVSDLCPFDTLTEFLGAADPTHGSTTSGKNSMFIPVMNMPLPNTGITTNPVINGNGWVSNTSVIFNFTSNAANYSATGNPPANGFTQAPPYSLTYGVAPATTPIPDTTYPISTDTTNWNPNANANFGRVSATQTLPLCPSGLALSFGSTATLVETPGVYNMHYFTTDCALTEELLFSATSLTDPTANWASFRVLSFGVDNAPPVLAACTVPAPSPNSNGWYHSGVTASCGATDVGSGFSTGTPITPSVIPNTNGVLQGSLTATLTPSTTGTGSAAQILPQTITDLAGNMSNSVGPYPTPIDNTAPTLTAKFSVSGTSFTFGQTVTAKFTCADTISGLATCGTQTVAACAAAPTVNPASLAFTSPSAVTIDTTSPAALSNNGIHTLIAVDCAGNMSAPVTYTVSLGSADLGIGNIPSPLGTIKNNSNLTYNIFVLNLSGNLATNVVVTNPIPANTTYQSAMSGIVSCTLAGCNNLTTGSACTPTYTGAAVTSVSCTTPSVKPFLPGLTGFVIKLVVKVSVPKNVTSVTNVATVSEANPDPVKGDNTSTLTTKVSQ